MPVDFSKIKKGSEWDRNELAELWGFRSFHAIARGVFTPARQKIIVLFVTEDKQPDFTQYQDRLAGSLLIWEGEEGHGNDSRIAEATARGDQIHLFHRTRHHASFTYHGEVKVKSVALLSDRPSQFEFELV